MSKNLFQTPNLTEIVSNSFDKFENYGFTLLEEKDFEHLESEINDEKKEYELLYSQDNDNRVMWKKMKGEGSKHDEDNSGLTIRHKYKMVVPYNSQLFYDVLRSYEHRYLWDEREGGREILQIFNVPNKPQNQVVEYLVKKGNLLVATRDFVTINAEKYNEEDKSYLLIGKSIDQYPKESKYLRSTILYLGMKIVPINENSCEFYCVTQVHPRGWIPLWVYEWVLQFLPKEFHQLTTKACQLRIEQNYPSFINYYQLYNKPNNNTQPNNATSTCDNNDNNIEQ
ncbi:hypothetical protein ABK040_009793 [Willaertia magna]